MTMQYLTPQERRRRQAAARRLARVHDAETWQSYFPDRAPDERTPAPGIDAVHHQFTEYLDSQENRP